MRSVLYWLTSTIVAVLCIKAAATTDFDESVLTATVPAHLVTTSPDPLRAILLGVGIMAVAYTYRRVWLNFTSGQGE